MSSTGIGSHDGSKLGLQDDTAIQPSLGQVMQQLNGPIPQNRIAAASINGAAEAEDTRLEVGHVHCRKQLKAMLPAPQSRAGCDCYIAPWVGFKHAQPRRGSGQAAKLRNARKARRDTRCSPASCAWRASHGAVGRHAATAALHNTMREQSSS